MSPIAEARSSIAKAFCFYLSRPLHPAPLVVLLLICPAPLICSWETLRYLMSNLRWWLDEFK